MPVPASLALKIYPSDFPLKKRKNQWIVDCQTARIPVFVELRSVVHFEPHGAGRIDERNIKR
jgi:hypothetical protein